MLKPNPLSDGIWRWGFGEVIRSWSSHGDGSKCLIRRGQRASLFCFCQGWIQKMGSFQLGSLLLAELSHAGSLILDFSPSRTVRNTLLSFKSPSLLWYFVMPAQTDQDKLEEYRDNKVTWSSHPLLVTYHTFQELGVGFRRQRKPGVTCLPLSHLFSLIYLDSPRLASNALQGITSLVSLITFYSSAFIFTDLLPLLGTPSLTALPSSSC